MLAVKRTDQALNRTEIGLETVGRGGEKSKREKEAFESMII